MLALSFLPNMIVDGYIGGLQGRIDSCFPPNVQGGEDGNPVQHLLLSARTVN